MIRETTQGSDTAFHPSAGDTLITIHHNGMAASPGNGEITEVMIRPTFTTYFTADGGSFRAKKGAQLIWENPDDKPQRDHEAA